MTYTNPILKAFSPGGSETPGAGICYHSLLVRDLGMQARGTPWWHALSPEMPLRIARARDIINTFGLDWYQLGPDAPRLEREGTLEERDGRVAFVRASDGAICELYAPVPGGGDSGQYYHDVYAAAACPASVGDVNRLVPPVDRPFDRAAFEASGQADFPKAFAEHFPEVARVMHVNGPLWSLFGTMGYETVLILMAEAPALIEQAAANRLTHALAGVEMCAACGAQIVWIEECMMDQMHPDLYRAINAPLIRTLTAAIHEQGMKSVYYFCGDPWPRFDTICTLGFDALALEEGKKGFSIDIMDVVARVSGSFALAGNVDSCRHFMTGDADALRCEIERQWMAGQRNGGRFFMNTGSPVPPECPEGLVAAYARFAHGLSPDGRNGSGRR